MWPRTAEDTAKGFNSGFVSYLTRTDAERAFDTLQGAELDKHVLRLSWAKPVRADSVVQQPLPDDISRDVSSASSSAHSSDDGNCESTALRSFAEENSPYQSAETVALMKLLPSDFECNTMMPSASVKELDNIISSLTTDQLSIGRAMVFCIDHAEWSEAVVAKIAMAAGSDANSARARIATIYLISDILYNSSRTELKRAWTYRGRFEKVLVALFAALGVWYRGLEGRLAARNVATSVGKVLDVWDQWCLYPPALLASLRDGFFRAAAEQAPFQRVCPTNPASSESQPPQSAICSDATGNE